VSEDDDARRHGLRNQVELRRGTAAAATTIGDIELVAANFLR